MNRLILAILLVFLCCFALPKELLAQTECVSINSALNLSTLFAGTPCAGASDFDIENSSASGVVDCTSCAASVNTGAGVGTFDVIANPGPGECTVTVTVLDPSFTVTSSGPSDCSVASLQVNQPLAGIDYDWVIQPGNVQLSGANVNYTFNSGQPDITLTVSDSDCAVDFTSTQNNVTGLGPFASLSFDGLFGGFFNSLNIADDGAFCTVSYCTNNTTADNQFTFTDNSYSDAGISNYTVIYNGTNIYDQGIAPAGITVNLSDATDLGYNILEYTVTDGSGCVSTKEYRVYWEALVLPQFSITSVLPDITQAYCSGDVLQVTFEAGAQNPTDVTYSWAIGCNALSAEDIVPLSGFNTLNLQSGESTVVNIPLNSTSCGCTGDDLVIFALVGNPCNELSIDATEIIQVSLDFTPSFTLDSPICLGETIDLSWDAGGQQTSNVPYCNPTFLWSSEDQTGGGGATDISNQEVTTFTPPSAGLWEFCLEISSACAPAANEICQVVCVEEALNAADFTLDWSNTSFCLNTGDYEPTVTANPALFTCNPLDYTWSISSQPVGANATVTGSNTETPSFDLPVKGTYTLALQIANDCGPLAVPFTQEITVIGQPQLSEVVNPTTFCPEDNVALDDFFCVDLCFGNIEPTGTYLQVLDGAANCGSVSVPLEEWTNIASFGTDMLATGNCNSAAAIPSYTYSIPASAAGTQFTALLYIETECGTSCEAITFDVLDPQSLGLPDPITLCPGEALNPSDAAYNAFNGPGFTWSIGGQTWTTGSAPLTIAASDVLTVTGTVGGCEVMATSNVDVLPSFNPSIAAPDPVCLGGTTDLIASPNAAGYTFQWYNGTCAALGSSIGGETNDTYAAPAIGSYAVEITSSIGCAECAEINVASDPSPGFSCSLGPYCATQTSQVIDLTCLTPPVGTWGANLPSWTLDEGGTNIITSLNTPADPSTLNYTVGDLLLETGGPGTFTFTYSWTSPAGCIYSDSFDLVIQDLTPFTIPLPADTCAGTVINPASFPSLAACDWTVNSVLLAAGETFTINGPTTIEVSCGTGACINSDNTTIGVYPAIAPGISTTQAFLCQIPGAVLELSATGTDANAFQWYNGTCALIGPPIAGATNPTYDASVAGEYAVEVTNSSGCVECAEILVELDPSPGFSCALGPYCETETAQVIDLSCLTPPAGGWGASLPSWIITLSGTDVPTLLNTPADPATVIYTIEDLLLDAGSAGIFTFTYSWTSPAGCTYSESFDLEVQALDPISIPLPAVTCVGTEIDPTSFPALSTCDWIVDGIPLLGGEVFLINGLTSIEVNCTDGVCVNSDATTVDVFPPVAPDVTSAVPFVCQDAGADLELTASGSSATSYQWYNGTCALLGTAIAGATSDTYSAPSIGNYAVEVTSSNGCLECAQFTVEVDPGPSFICADLSFCENEFDEQIPFGCLTPPIDGWQGSLPEFTISDALGFEIPSTLLLDPIDPALVTYTVQDLLADHGPIDADSDFTFSYIWTSPSGCIYEDEFTVNLSAIDFDFPVTEPTCQGDEIMFPGGLAGEWYTDMLTDNGIDPTDIFINADGDLILSTDEDTPTLEFDSLVYTVGCAATVYDHVYILESPEVLLSNELELCIHDMIQLSVDPGSSQTTSINYTNDEGEFDIPISSPQFFDPMALSILSTEPGLLTYVGIIETTVIGTTYTCSDTSFSDVDIYEIPQSNILPDFCEGIPLEPELCTDPLVNSFELLVDGSLFDTCPLNFEGIFGIQNYDLTLFYGNGCFESNSGDITIQQALEYSLDYEVDECIPELSLNIDFTAGMIETVTFLPGGVFTNDILDQTVTLPVDVVLDDQNYSYQVNIDDGGCVLEEVTLTAEYIAPLESIVTIPNGTSLCSPALVPFDLFQIGSGVVDSVIFVPGDGSPSELFINDYDDIEHLYISDLDTNLYVAEFYLFNPCDTDTLTVDLLIEPPVFSASIDEFITVCQGDTIDLSPFTIGSYVSQSVLPAAGLSLNLFDVTQPFLFIVPESQEADTFSVSITLTPDCGLAAELTTQVIVNPIPQPTIEYELNCFESLSSFSVLDPQTDVVYSWELPGDIEVIGSSAETAFDQPGDNTIVLNSMNVNGCSSRLIETIDVPGFYPLSLSDTSACGAFSLDLSAEILPDEMAQWTIIGLNSNYNVFYPTDDINHFFPASTVPDSVASYMAIVDRSEGLCSASDTLMVNIFPVPEATILISEDPRNPAYDPGELTILGLCPDDFLYYSSASEPFNCSFSLGGTIEDCGTPDNCGGFGTLCIPFSFESGQIDLFVNNKYGCTAEDNLVFGATCDKPIDVYVPNAFTPDGDLLNEFFLPVIVTYDNEITSYDLRIYNRYGCEIWKGEDPLRGWDGNSTQICHSPTLNPSENSTDYYSQDEVYTWTLEVRYRKPDSDEFTPVVMTGAVTLIR